MLPKTLTIGIDEPETRLRLRNSRIDSVVIGQDAAGPVGHFSENIADPVQMCLELGIFKSAQIRFHIG